MKTYIVEWFNKTRNGAWRDYRKVVKTDDIESYVRDTMKLTVGCMAYGHYKGSFRFAVEVEDTNRLGYKYKTKLGGERWFVKSTGEMAKSKATDRTFYDNKLKGWLVHDADKEDA